MIICERLEENKIETYLKIYDIISEKMILETLLTSNNFIGKLKSNIYQFHNGYWYYRDSVVKVRYDLINSIDASSYTDKHFLDEYNNLFKLNEG